MNVVIVMDGMTMKLDQKDGQGFIAKVFTDEGKSAERTLTDNQAAATLALCVGEMEGEGGKELTKALYKLAEPAWTGVEAELRPIP